MGSCASVSDPTTDEGLTDYVDACTERGHFARGNCEFSVALEWYLEAFRAKIGYGEHGVGEQYEVNYDESYYNLLINIGLTYFTLRQEEQAFVYLLRAIEQLDPMMDRLARMHSTALRTYVRVTSALVLLYTSAALDGNRTGKLSLDSFKRKATAAEEEEQKREEEAEKEKEAENTVQFNLMLELVQEHEEKLPPGGHQHEESQQEEVEEDKAFKDKSATRLLPTSALPLLDQFHPLHLAEYQLFRCISLVTMGEGPRSFMLISLFHLLARVYILMREQKNALRVMQRCLGLTRVNCYAGDASHVQSYTLRIVTALKAAVKRHDSAVMLQRWWRCCRFGLLVLAYIKSQTVPKWQIEAATAVFQNASELQKDVNQQQSGTFSASAGQTSGENSTRSASPRGASILCALQEEGEENSLITMQQEPTTLPGSVLDPPNQKSSYKYQANNKDSNGYALRPEFLGNTLNLVNQEQFHVTSYNKKITPMKLWEIEGGEA